MLKILVKEIYNDQKAGYHQNYHHISDFFSSRNCFLFGMKMYQSHKNIQLVDSYIEDKHLKGLIKKRKQNIVPKRCIL